MIISDADAKRLIAGAVDSTSQEMLLLRPHPAARFGFEVAYGNPTALRRGSQIPADRYEPELFFNPQQCQRLSATLALPSCEWRREEYEEVVSVNGANRHYIVQLLPVQAGELPPCILCSRRYLPQVEDIRQDLLSQMEGLRSIVQNSNNSLIYLKPDYTVVMANQTAQDNQFARTGRHYIPGTSMLDYIDREEAEEGIGMLAEMEKDMQVAYYERRVTYPTGDRWFQRKFYPTFDICGHYNGFVIASTEITAQKQQMIRVEQQNQALREIAMMQSHETRRPLANILSLVYLLQEDMRRLPEDPTTSEHLDLLLESTRQLDEVIRKIVAHTRRA